jgi:Transposase and inactivated derivatives
MSKYSYEQRLEAVKLVLEEKLSDYEAAKVTGIPRSPIRRWVSRYNQFGVEGLLLKHGTYTGDFKISVIEYMHVNHLSLCETAVRFGIPIDATVGIWERIYYEKGPRGLYEDNRGSKKSMSSDTSKKPRKLDPNAEEDLIAEVQRLRMENAYLKKLNALVQERITRENGKKQLPSKN